MAEASVHGLIGDLYDLATGGGPEEGWPAILRGLASLLGAQNVSMHREGGSLPRPTILATLNVPSETARAYREYFFSRDIALMRLARAPQGQAFYTQTYLSDAEVEASEFYNDLLRPGLGNAFYVAGVEAPLGDQTLVLGLHRAREMGPYTPEQMATLQILWPHLMRAMRVEEQLLASRTLARIGYAALDELPSGIAILRADRRCIFMNRAGRRMLLRRGGPMLQSGGGRLRLLQPSADAMFATLLGQATAGQPSRAGSMRCPSAEGHLALMLVPFRLPLPDLPPVPGPLALLLASDPNAAPGQLGDQVMAMFNVTRAEAEVAASLATGLSVEEVALARGVRLTTIRSQVQSLLAKTGTNRQGELLRLLLSLPRLAPPEA
ncbi:helix-turn-helix transcriptional regulator [Pseudoroseomonas cervicalis]|uniref:HTH luxR-type domain-containing protein n=1 Tax=Pseudoroseomonas cervicalis ATCC 49957 TaxID=525371 RepID=D5RQ99_9PROT|nr:helix-turn-helix transcriptional regulator [Pseudoroseomonas cervicalis]EFH10557.1 hypothetical protein HMPREF0731_3261 [Pseudoroseomonas cervicalis ATCC 49957]